MHIQRLLYPTDFSACSEQALSHALFLARAFDAELHVVHVVPVAPAYPMAGVAAEDSEDLDEMMERAREMVRDHKLDDGSLDVEVAVERGEGIGESILGYASEHDVDLIALGTHGRRGVRRFFIGSEAEEVIRGSECPVLAVRKRDDAPPALPQKARVDRIVAPVDLSTHSRTALAHAAALARKYDADLTLLHVVEPMPDYNLSGTLQAADPPSVPSADRVEDDVRDAIDALLDEVDLDAGRVQVAIEHGRPAPSIVDYAAAEDADLLVLASHGRTGLQRFLMGSVAEKVMRSAPCPLFVVKACGRDQ